MTGRKLLIALAAAALYAVVLVASASAEMHRVQVTLVTGQVITVTVDVPPGTPVQQVQIPGLPAPVQDIVDLGPVATPTPVPVPTVPAVPATCRTSTSRLRRRQARERSGGGGDSTAAAAAAAATPAAAAAPRRRGGGDESPVNRADGNVRSGVGRAQGQGRGRRSAATNPDGSPDPGEPDLSLSTPGPARIGVPNFFIDKFRIPPFLLPIYQAAGIQYGVRWEVLAAINEIETDYGRNLNVSSAGALGLDAVHALDVADCTASTPTATASRTRTTRSTRSSPPRATCAPPAPTRDIRRAVFAYNHADWYVDSVLLRAQVIGGLPADLVGSLTGLTQGRFPVQAKATYAGQLQRSGKRVRQGNAAMVVEADRPPRHPRSTRARARPWSPSTTAGSCEIGDRGGSAASSMLQDVYGNTYTYGHLASGRQALPVAEAAARQRGGDRARAEAAGARRGARPGRLGDRPAREPGPKRKLAERAAPTAARRRPRRPAGARDAAKERLFANPTPPERLGAPAATSRSSSAPA